MDYLTPDKTFFTVLDYDMSYVEFFGTVLNFASVWLVIRRNVLTWPVGIAGVALFAALFYQIELYSDFVEQLYFLATGFYAWRLWSRRTNQPAVAAQVTVLASRTRLFVASVVAVGTLALGTLMADVHTFLPRLFADPAALPFLDAFTTVMSFAAQILMAHRKLESWLLWILVDVIGIWLYHDRGVTFISMLYGVFLVLAVRGLVEWLRDIRINERQTVAATAMVATAR